MLNPSEKASQFTESVIREMTRVALAHGAVNLSQGFPDFPAPEEVKAAAVRAVGAANGRNPYCIVVPCHRVVGADGTLTGYAGGLDRKRFLLDLERGLAPSAPAQLSLLS